MNNVYNNDLSNDDYKAYFDYFKNDIINDDDTLDPILVEYEQFNESKKYYYQFMEYVNESKAYEYSDELMNLARITLKKKHWY